MVDCSVHLQQCCTDSLHTHQQLALDAPPQVAGHQVHAAVSTLSGAPGHLERHAGTPGPSTQLSNLFQLQSRAPSNFKRTCTSPSRGILHSSPHHITCTSLHMCPRAHNCTQLPLLTYVGSYTLTRGCNQEVVRTYRWCTVGLYAALHYTTLVVVIPLERVESLLEVIRVHPRRHHLLATLLLFLSDLGPVQSGGDVGQLQVEGNAQLV